MTTPRKTLVDQAIRFENPERIPIVFWNCDQTEGDVLFRLLHLLADVEDVLESDEREKHEHRALKHQREGDS